MSVRGRLALAARLGALALGLTAGAGCGAPAAAESYLLAMAEGGRAYNAGRYQEAARAFARAESEATRVKDRDEAIFLRARMAERQGHWDEAAELYRHLVQVSADGPRAVRAIFELAENEIAHGEQARGWEALRAALLRYPNHGSARRALKRVAEHLGETEGEPAARRFLAQSQTTFAGTEAESQARYENAKSLEREGLLAEARDEYAALAQAHPYPLGSLTDDSLWRAALIEEQLGRYPQAVALLEQMIAPAERGITGASYERPRFPNAQLRIARLYRDHLHDDEAARRAFHRMLERHPEAAATDDALWQEALLAKKAGDDDDVCALMRTLKDDYPSSRYLRCLDRLCPSEAAVDEQRRGCPPYLQRTLSGDPEPGELGEGDAGGSPPE